MTWRDAVAFAARSVRRRLGRAVLTVLAVSLASALLSSLLIAGDVARSRVLDQVSRGGPLAGIKVDAAEAVSGALDSDNPRRGAPKTIDDALRKRIENVPGVRSVLPVIAQPVWVVPPTPAVIPTAPAALLAKPSIAQPKEYGNGIVGADLRRTNDLPITVLEGRLPDPNSTTEIAVTPAYIEHFGIEANDRKFVVGTEIEFGSARSIAGIVGAAGPSNERRQSPRGRWVRALIVGVVAQDVDARVQLLVPENVVRAARAWSVGGDDPRIFGTPTSPYAALFVVASGLDKVGPVRKAINEIGFSTSTSEQLIADVQRYVHVVEIVLTGIGFIGLMIAALGISNAMLAAVRERRREIGVMKAIGARDRDVRRMFLLEAGFLGALGGAVGTAFGYGIARGLAAVVNNYLANQGFEGVLVGFPRGGCARGCRWCRRARGDCRHDSGPSCCSFARAPSNGGPMMVNGSRRPARALLRIGVVFALFASACSSNDRRVLPSAARNDKVVNVVAIGDQASLSFRGGITVTTSWPQIFFREALPRSATFVNLATPRASVSEARERQTSVLASLRPNLVTIMLGFEDFDERTSSEFAADLDRLLDDVEQSGAVDAYIAILPASEAGLRGVSDVLAALPSRHGSVAITLVDLRKLPISYLTGERQRFVPDVASQRVIANAFIAAYQRTK